MTRISYILAAIYLTLLLGTGWVAFFREDYIASTDPEHIQALYSPKMTAEDKQVFKDGLNQLTANNQKRQELAFQSFNIVLGAVLGFLSALAAVALKKDGTPPG